MYLIIDIFKIVIILKKSIRTFTSLSPKTFKWKRLRVLVRSVKIELGFVLQYEHNTETEINIRRTWIRKRTEKISHCESRLAQKVPLHLGWREMRWNYHTLVFFQKHIDSSCHTVGSSHNSCLWHKVPPLLAVTVSCVLKKGFDTQHSTGSQGARTRWSDVGSYGWVWTAQWHGDSVVSFVW